MGNPLNGTGLFAHTYADFNVHLDVEYQLIDGYLRCNSTPNPGYSSAVRSLTTLENLLPTNHPRYVEIMANYGTQIWISYALDIVQLPGMLATQQFLCEKLAVCKFLRIVLILIQMYICNLYIYICPISCGSATLPPLQCKYKKLRKFAI